MNISVDHLARAIERVLTEELADAYYGRGPDVQRIDSHNVNDPGTRSDYIVLKFFAIDLSIGRQQFNVIISYEGSQL